MRLATELGIPVVGRVASSGADVNEGVAALHAWGRVAKALSDASGVVPVVLLLVGPAVSGPALLLGIVDAVIMTSDAFAYVTGPDVVVQFTGVAIDRDSLGGAHVHDRHSGVAALVVHDEDEAVAAAGTLLGYLPANHLDDPPRFEPSDAVDRDCARAAATIPARATASYDVRDIVADVLDDDSFFELRRHTPRAWSRGSAGSTAVRSAWSRTNRSTTRAASTSTPPANSAVRAVVRLLQRPPDHVRRHEWLPPGRDQEWRGVIRHGAELLHAYAAATVPRLCVVLRKAYGGAYIVMDSRGLGTDWCIAWPTAEIAVLGAPPRGADPAPPPTAAINDPAARTAEEQALTAEYEDRFLNPYAAAERGYVDDVIAATDTRRALAGALQRLSTKREHRPSRRHSNTPL